jgi:hypothetical protein
MDKKKMPDRTDVGDLGSGCAAANELTVMKNPFYYTSADRTIAPS